MNTALPEMLEAIRADAARRAGVPLAAVQAAAPQSVTWPDGSLGCPEPGRLYTQALVQGWKVTVKAGAQTLDYHASLRGGWRHCPKGQGQRPVPDTRS